MQKDTEGDFSPEKQFELRRMLMVWHLVHLLFIASVRGMCLGAVYRAHIFIEWCIVID